jgi:hypothetical protein
MLLGAKPKPIWQGLATVGPIGLTSCLNLLAAISDNKAIPINSTNQSEVEAFSDSSL